MGMGAQDAAGPVPVLLSRLSPEPGSGMAMPGEALLVSQD
jgi:hypothetical protein